MLVAALDRGPHPRARAAISYHLATAVSTARPFGVISGTINGLTHRSRPNFRPPDIAPFENVRFRGGLFPREVTGETVPISGAQLEELLAGVDLSIRWPPATRHCMDVSGGPTPLI